MGENNAGETVVVSTKRSRLGFKRMLNTTKKKRPYIKYILLIVVLGLVGVGIQAVRDREARISKNICNGRDNNAFYTSVAPKLYSRRYRELSADVVKVKLTKDYQKDANCLYVLVYYYVSVSDAVNAKDNYSKLEKVYNSKKGFAKPLASRAGSLEDVKKEVAKVDQSREQFDKNKVFTN